MELSEILPPFSPPGRFITELARMPFATACASFHTSQLWGLAPNEARHTRPPPLIRRGSRGNNLHQSQPSHHVQSIIGIIDDSTVFSDGSKSEGHLQARDTGGARGLYNAGETKRSGAHINSSMLQRFRKLERKNLETFDSRRSVRQCNGSGDSGGGGFASCRGGSPGSIDLTQDKCSGGLDDGGGGRAGSGRGFFGHSGSRRKCVDGEVADLPLETRGREGSECRGRGQIAEDFASASNISGDTTWRRHIATPAVRRRARSLSASFCSSLGSSCSSSRGPSLSFPFSSTGAHDGRGGFAVEREEEQKKYCQNPADRLAWMARHVRGERGRIFGELEHRLLGELIDSGYSETSLLSGVSFMAIESVGQEAN